MTKDPIRKDGAMASSKKRRASDEAKATTQKEAGTSNTTPTSVQATSSLALGPACQAVFDTTELIEAIIVYLPVKDIFVIQRVSQQSRDVITNSVQIQQKVFIRPYAKGEELKLCRNNIPSGWDDPFYLSRSAAAPSQVNITVVEEGITAVQLCQFPLSPPMIWGSAAHHLAYGDRTTVDILLSNIMSGCGSWRKMLLTDPPCRSVEVFCTSVETMSGPKATFQAASSSTSNSAGVTLGDVFDAICQQVDLAFMVDQDGQTFGKIGRNPLDEHCKQCFSPEEVRAMTFSVTVTAKLPQRFVVPTEWEWEAINNEAASDQGEPTNVEGRVEDGQQ